VLLILAHNITFSPIALLLLPIKDIHGRIILCFLKYTGIEQLSATTKPSESPKKSTSYFIIFCTSWTCGASQTEKLQKGLLHKANDWKIIVDLEEFNYIFPPEIIPTSLRPYVVVWSNQLKRAIIIELTCSAEEGI
jgi:hypothetical protein